MPAGGPRDFWDKLAIILQPVGGLLTAFAVAAVGLLGSQVLERRQSADTNARLYSELMSRREEAESALRKDMFQSIIGSFFDPKEGKLEDRVLNLELLAQNFNDSLNLKPLFVDIRRRIDESSHPRKKELGDRINGVARQIAEKQLFALEGRGDSFRRTVDLEELARAGKAGVPLDNAEVSSDGKRCTVALRVLKASKEQQQLTVRLEVSEPDGEGTVDTRATFDVGYFDFPMIDNTRLANGLRCAVTLRAFSKDMADLGTVCFPGEYASLKDRPYYDEVIQKLREEAERASTTH